MVSGMADRRHELEMQREQRCGQQEEEKSCTPVCRHRSSFASMNIEDVERFPGSILNLKALVAGQVIDLVSDLRDFATMTLMADLFESCVIFEEAKKEEAKEVENDLAD